MKSLQPDLYIWDFDGVISDSLQECFAVVTLAVYRYQFPEKPVTSADLIDICSVEEIKILDSWMRPLRPFIVKGQDYLWQYFNRESFADGFDSMNEYKKTFNSLYDPQQDDEYRELFYSSRALLRELMGKKYMGLLTAHYGAIHALRFSLSRNRNYVCTARDRRALELVLERHQITIPREYIYSQDFNAKEKNKGLGKTEQILKILDAEGGRKQNFTIVEDQVKAPAGLQPDCPNMRVLFASYGYGLRHDWYSANLSKMVEVKNSADLICEIY